MKAYKVINKSVKECMREAMLVSLIEALAALRKDNVDNGVLREVKAIHGNTTFADLPVSVQIALENAVDAAFSRLSAEGYGITTQG